MKSLLREDTIGVFGLNIGTSALLETVITGKLWDHYDRWLINISTLIRNFVDCMDMNVSEKVKMFKNNNITQLIDEISAEIDYIIKIMDVEFVVFYTADRSKVIKSLPEDQVRSDTDMKGAKYWLVKKEKKIIDSIVTNSDITLSRFNHRLPNLSKTLVTTHIPIDLLSYSYVPHVGLLESYTGELKGKDLWYTKYHPIGKRDMSVFPFIEELYYVLGDRVLVKPLDIKIRRKLYDIALDKNWNFKTGRGKIRSDIKSKDKELWKIVDSYKLNYALH